MNLSVLSQKSFGQNKIWLSTTAQSIRQINMSMEDWFNRKSFHMSWKTSSVSSCLSALLLRTR